MIYLDNPYFGNLSTGQVKGFRTNSQNSAHRTNPSHIDGATELLQEKNSITGKNAGGFDLRQREICVLVVVLVGNLPPDVKDMLELS